MTHMETYKTAGKTLREWISEHPPTRVSYSTSQDYMVEYKRMFLVVEKELFQAYSEKEINDEEYGKKCKLLDDIDKEIMDTIKKGNPLASLLSGMSPGGMSPGGMPPTDPSNMPSLEDIIKMLRKRDKGDGSGFIIFGGNLP